MRIGMGYDVHRLAVGRALVLGGVTVPHPTGLVGHSDADVLIHAICDALLGAAGLGDIGMHFPDSDPAYKGVSSMLLLAETAVLLRENGFVPVNVDATLLAQEPKIQPYRSEMRKNIACAAGMGETAVNIKATTTEGLGSIGRKEGMAASCIALIEPVAI